MKRSQVSVAIAALLSSSVVMADPVRLTDGALDQVTAGTPEYPLQGSGGAIVGNNSEATLFLTGTLDLSDEAQAGANGLNLVNSSESTVANGVNVWDGKLPAGTTPGANGQFDVTQENIVHQEQRRVALLPSYERSGANTSSSWTEDSSSTSASSSITSREARALETSTSSRELTSSGEVDTQSLILGQEIKGGRGIAGAGDLHIDFAAGEVNWRASAGVGQVLSGEIALDITLPQFTIDFNGAGCAVQMGSCKGQGTLKETTVTSVDNTVIETEETTQESSETFVGGGTEEVRSPFVLADAQAEYVVVDDSKIDVESNYGITLAGAAQSELRALNAVNAAGSAVANAVNISRTPSLTATASLSLVQRNVIGHSR